VEMVLHDHPCVQSHLLVAAAVIERAHQDVTTGRGGENRQPADDRGCDKMRSLRIVYSVSATHNGTATKLDRGVSTAIWPIPGYSSPGRLGCNREPRLRLAANRATAFPHRDKDAATAGTRPGVPSSSVWGRGCGKEGCDEAREDPPPAAKRSLRLQASMQLPLRAWRMSYRAVHSPRDGIAKPSVWQRGRGRGLRLRTRRSWHSQTLSLGTRRGRERGVATRPALSGRLGGSLSRRNAVLLEKIRTEQTRQRSSDPVWLRDLSTRGQVIDSRREQMGDGRSDGAGSDSMLLRELLHLFRPKRLLNLIGAHGKIAAGAKPRLHLGPQPGRHQLLQQAGKAVPGGMILHEIGENLRGGSCSARRTAGQYGKCFAGD